MTPIRPLALLAVLGGAAACAPTSRLDGRTPLAISVPFACSNGAALTVSFERDRARVIAADGEQSLLRQQRSGSGFRYARDGHELRGKGQEVTLARPAQPPLACRAAPLPASAQAAAASSPAIVAQ